MPSLLALRDHWVIHLVLAVALACLCLTIIGTARAVYTTACMTARWCAVFALVGAAVRFLSCPGPAR